MWKQPKQHIFDYDYETNDTEGNTRLLASGNGAEELYIRHNTYCLPSLRFPPDRDTGHGEPHYADGQVR